MTQWDMQRKELRASDFVQKISVVSVKLWFTFLSTNYVSVTIHDDLVKNKTMCCRFTSELVKHESTSRRNSRYTRQNFPMFNSNLNKPLRILTQC